MSVLISPTEPLAADAGPLSMESQSEFFLYIHLDCCDTILVQIKFI